jgi:hypothetical protein
LIELSKESRDAFTSNGGDKSNLYGGGQTFWRPLNVALSRLSVRDFDIQGKKQRFAARSLLYSPLNRSDLSLDADA